MSIADERKKKKLLSLYPDGVVVALRDKNSLYQMIFTRAKKLNVTVKEYIESLGFDYVDRRQADLEEILKELDDLYPNGVITNLISADHNLYQKVLNYAKKQNITIREFFESIELEYVDSRCSGDFNNIEQILLQHFPNRQVKSLSSHNHRLYIKIFRDAQKENKSVEEYLSDFGFDYVTSKKQNPLNSDEKIKVKLTELYPNKKVDGLSKNNINLYRKIQLLSCKRNMGISEYLNHLGFVYDVGRKKKSEILN